MNGQAANPLPAELSPLLGRERDLGELTRLLGEGTRLLTLRGPGGIGKTALALRLAHAVRGNYDHVLFVDLSALRAPGEVLSAIAAALPGVEAASRDPPALVREFAARHRLLLVLDNFEQLLPAARTLGELLARAPTLQLVVTSRAALHLHDEREYPVPPLPVPERVPEAASSPAVQLFVTRARALLPGFELTPATTPQVVRLCALLEGVPLALELAAARLRTYALPDVLAGLEHPLRFLREHFRDRPERLRSLRAAVEWSYELLDQGDRAVFECCAVFGGSFTPGALAAVYGGEEVLDHVDALIEQSFLQRLGTPGTRWKLLQPLRELALERLSGRPEAPTWRERHARHFLEELEEGRRRFEQGQPDRREDLLPDYPNMRAGLVWAVGEGRADLAYRYLAQLGAVWLPLGLYAQEAPLAERVLGLPSPGRDHVLLRALEVSAQCLAATGQTGAHEARLREILELCRELGDEVSAGWTTADLALLHHASGRSDLAWPMQQEVLRAQEARRGERGADRVEQSQYANLLLYAAPTLLDLGQPDLALAYATRALEEYEAARNAVFRLVARVMVGVVLLHLGRREEAGARLLGALHEAAGKPFRAVVDEALRGLSLLAAEVGDPALAVRLLAAGGFVPGEASRGYLDRRHLGNLDRARAVMGEADFRDAWASGSDLGPAEAVEQADRLARRLRAPPPDGTPRPGLTPREWEVLRLVAQGHPDRRVARLLGISPVTVSKHVANMLGKLALHNRVELTRWAMTHGGEDSP